MAPKEEYVKIETRRISGKGIIVVPPSDKYRVLLLYVNVVRLPLVNFSSSKWNPDRSEYCRIAWERNAYIIRTDILGFESECYTFQSEPAGYIGKSLECMYTNLLYLSASISAAVGAPPLIPGPPIWTNPLNLFPTIIKFCCRLDTAIEVQLWRMYYDIACTEADSPPPPPPDEPPPPKVPPGTPIGDISPPPPGGGEPGDTEPNPGDEIAPPPEETQGGLCSTFRIVWSANFIEDSGNAFFYTEDMQVWGQAVEPYVGASPAGANPTQQVFINCRGLKYLGEPCGEYRAILLTNLNAPGGVEDLTVSIFEEIESP